MKIRLTEEANRWTKRRVRRHGDEYDLVLEHFIDDKPVPLGVLLKSHKTKCYVWFSSKQIAMPFYYGDLIPELIEGIKTYTPDKQLVYEYLDHLMDNVLSKRDRKKYGPIYERIKDDQLNLIDRLNLA